MDSHAVFVGVAVASTAALLRHKLYARAVAPPRFAPAQKADQATLLPGRMGDDTALVSALRDTAGRCTTTVFRPGDEPATGIGAGDAFVIHGVLSPEECEAAFTRLTHGEVDFQQWYHMADARRPTAPLRPLARVKVAQADVNSAGLLPHYRFPVNNQTRHGVTPMSATVQNIRRRVVARLPPPFKAVTTEQLNHAVVLLYRTHNDRIGFHKDKTLDLADGVPIVSISLGQPRTYVLQDHARAPTQRQEVALLPGTMLVLGPRTNAEWYHSVRQMTPEEVAACGGATKVRPRVSITLRSAATFLNLVTHELSGKGAHYPSLDWPAQLKGAHRLDDDVTGALAPDAADDGGLVNNTRFAFTLKACTDARLVLRRHQRNAIAQVRGGVAVHVQCRVRWLTCSCGCWRARP